MRRSLVTIVTAGFLALGSGCSNFWGDSDTDQSQKPAAESAGTSNVASGMDRPYSAAQYERMLINVLRQAEAHGVTFEKDDNGNVVARNNTISLTFPNYKLPPGLTITYSAGAIEEVTLNLDVIKCVSEQYTANADSIEPFDITSCFGKPSPGPATASLTAGVVAGATRTTDTTWFDHLKFALTNKKEYGQVSVKDSDPDNRRLSGTFPSGNGVVIVCSAFIPGPPGKGKAPPKKVSEGCPYTIWKEYPRPSRQDIIDDVFNTVLRGKSVSGIEALTGGSADTLYTQLAEKFMLQYGAGLDTAIAKRVGEVRFYDTLREKSETRDIGGVNVKVGYSVQGDRYTPNGKDFASRVKIDEINDSNIRAGVKGKLLAALKGGALKWYDNHFYHKDNFDAGGKPTTSPATAVTVPNANYPKKSFHYAAQDRTVLDTTSPLCIPQSVDPTSTPLDKCGVGTSGACRTDVR